jgi:hypothetical protein
VVAIFYIFSPKILVFQKKKNIMLSLCLKTDRILGGKMEMDNQPILEFMTESGDRFKVIYSEEKVGNLYKKLARIREKEQMMRRQRERYNLEEKVG